VNSSVKMIGLPTASKSCSGTCFIFSIARHPNVSEAESAFGRLGRLLDESAERSASSEMAWDVLAGVVMRSSPLSCRSLLRQGVRLGRETLRRGSAVRGRNL
jgi:hypothetical protein